MFVGNERKITVRKEELLEKLRAGLTKHQTEFAKAKGEYVVAIQTFLEEASKRAEEGDVSDVHIPHSLQAPGNFSKDFERAIAMIEMSVESEITLDENTFKQWVLGEWAWAGSFEASAMSVGAYLSKSLRK